jgi:hypothetical protein
MNGRFLNPLSLRRERFRERVRVKGGGILFCVIYE